MIVKEGTAVPFFIAQMNLQQQIQALVEEKIAGTDNYLVEIKVSPSKITVILDHPRSLNLDECVAVSRYLHEQLEPSNVFEKHELEVSSPGMEEPLKVLPQYHKRLNHRVSVLQFDGMKRTGLLRAADEHGILLDEEYTIKEGKKKTIGHREVTISYDQIKETRVIFSFDKINSPS